jgi:hypothetical protein
MSNINNNISNNIKPYFWGPKLWCSIYSFVSVYPENPTQELINSAKLFFISIKELLPCKSCRNSYTKYIQETNTNITNNNNFSSRNNLIEFVFNLRNKINNKREVEYYITLKYFKKKLNLMICNDDNKLDSIINNLIEAPIISESIEDKVYNYLKKRTKYNTKNTQSIVKNIKDFMNNPNFNSNDSNFKLFCKRNYECRNIIKKIYNNMSIYNYDNYNESFKKDNNLHLKLLYLGCSILSKSELLEVIN